MRMKGLVVVMALVAVPALTSAQKGDQNEHHQVPADAAVDFGVLPTGPIGSPPCLQSGAIGGPGGPVAP